MSATRQPAASALTVRLVGGVVELTCGGCKLTLRQELRSPIAATCPRCGARWG